MPFVCKYQLNNGAIGSDDKIIFKCYIDSSFGTYQKDLIKISEAFLNGQAAFIYSNCPGFPSTKGNLMEGDIITPDTIIAYFLADGEDIPYHKPYAIIAISREN